MSKSYKGRFFNYVQVPPIALHDSSTIYRAKLAAISVASLRKRRHAGPRGLVTTPSTAIGTRFAAARVIGIQRRVRSILCVRRRRIRVAIIPSVCVISLSMGSDMACTTCVASRATICWSRQATTGPGTAFSGSTAQTISAYSTVSNKHRTRIIVMFVL